MQIIEQDSDADNDDDQKSEMSKKGTRSNITTKRSQLQDGFKPSDKGSTIRSQLQISK